MPLFKFEKGNVVIDMDVLAHSPVLAAVWQKDKSEGKELATAKLKLIYHMVNPNSQYATFSTIGRVEKIIQDLFPLLKDWKSATDKEYKAALSYYETLLDLVPEYALLKAAQNAVHELAAKISKKGTADKEVLLGKMRKAVEDLDAVKSIVEKAQEKQQSTKGKHAIRKREDPDYYQNK